MQSRRSFIGSTLGALALSQCRAAEALAAAATKDDFKWVALLHLGYNMWGDLRGTRVPKRDGSQTKLLTDEEFAAITTPEVLATDRMHFDEQLWREFSVKLRQCGCNCIMLDVGEGLRFPSHPELALKDSWSPEKLKAEVDRLRGMGFEVIPKLNFSTAHDAWLGPYERMVSTAKYYEVCSDLIRDTMEVFAPVRDFHLGMDEENRPIFHSSSSILVIRQGELWWHDVNWFVREVEKRGARAWMWTDYVPNHTKEQFQEEFCRKMPKTVVLDPWHNSAKKDTLATDKTIHSFLQLAEAGYDVAPGGSNCYGILGFPDMVEYCREKMPAERFKGVLMSPWVKMISPYRRLLWQAADQIAEARRRVS